MIQLIILLVRITCYYYKLQYTLIVPNTQAAVCIKLLLGNLEYTNNYFVITN